MSIIRERDYWQAKRLIPYWEQCIAKNETALQHATTASEKNYFEYYIELYSGELESAKKIVAEHGGATVRPSDVERPANEASLEQWVSI